MSDDSDSAVPAAKTAPTARELKVRRNAKNLAQRGGQDWKALTQEQRKEYIQQARANLKSKRQTQSAPSE